MLLGRKLMLHDRQEDCTVRKTDKWLGLGMLSGDKIVAPWNKLY